jgi:PBP1b-binding outer membrane lipoprotein LpoB
MKTVKHLLAFLMIILLSVFLCSCSQSAKAHAEKAIKKDLDLLKNLDSETTMQYISYQELFPDSDDSTKLSADIKEVFSLFFQNFDYKILDISVDSDEKNASAQLKLTTLDAEALASDFVSASLQEEILETASGKENDNGNSLEQRYLLLYKLLKNNTYSSVERNTSIQLNNLGSSSEPDWEITHSSSLENDLVGGLITYLSDLDLVPPAETLTVYLKTLQEMDVKQMANYLGLDSILNTSDSAKNAIASALMEQFHSCFNYKISSTSVSGYLAEVDAELTTFDSNSILTQYEKELNTYLASADAVIDGSQKRYNKSHELLLDSIRNNQATITATATFHLTNDGASWKLENAGTELGNAIFGTLTASPVPEDSTEDNE